MPASPATLLHPAILAMVFTPLAISAATLAALLPRAAGLAIAALPPDRAQWGTAMLAELHAIPGRAARWRFALGCLRAALLCPPSPAMPATPAARPILGLCAIAGPPLALPALYTTAMLPEASATTLPDPLLRCLVLGTAAAMLSGLPLGLAARLRREPLPALALAGSVSSLIAIATFLIAMRLLAGTS